LAQSSEELFAPIGACINEHAPTVEPIFDDLEAGTRFLAGSICAEVIEDRSKILLDQKLAAAQVKRDQKCKDVEKESREYMMECMSLDFAGQAIAYSVESIIPADARAAAAKKLLELRTSRLVDENKGN